MIDTDQYSQPYCGPRRCTSNVVKVHLEESLQDALDKMAKIKLDELPMVSEADPDKIITLPKRDIISYYYEQIQRTV